MTDQSSSGTERYYGPNWDEIRKEVIESDGSQCVVCLSSENLVVHHRKPLSEFESHEQANQRKNLATLCKRCHRMVESIQKPHTRRGLSHFKEELSSENIEIDSQFIEFLCYNTPKSDAPNADCCSEQGCFYPVKSSDITCPSCGKRNGSAWGHPADRHDEPSKKETYVCTHCGDKDKFANKPLNQHGCSESPNHHHQYQRANSKESKPKSQ